jgi:hypothetical protein
MYVVGAKDGDPTFKWVQINLIFTALKYFRVHFHLVVFDLVTENFV